MPADTVTRMFLLAHLFAGLLIGLLLYLFFRDRSVILVCGLGGVLPDLIDKPIGHILLKGSFDYGRLYFHGIFVFLLIFIAGILFLRYYKTALLLVLSIGILSHQVLDAMWYNPVAWFYPLLGTYPKRYNPNFFEEAFWAQLNNPSEWVFFIIAACLIALIYRHEVLKQIRAFRQWPLRRWLAILIPALIAVVALLVIMMPY
ncbi:hypothetical protein ASZ90_009236 [hydrocarbon metagenome]|uniref:Membrane-bound metal-dependent hydrolase n=1 Tax=hydrocarbon metagenome TaxID=938273 RepID=A0A0W8FJD8_9ZZZZ